MSTEKDPNQENLDEAWEDDDGADGFKELFELEEDLEEDEEDAEEPAAAEASQPEAAARLRSEEDPSGPPAMPPEQKAPAANRQPSASEDPLWEQERSFYVREARALAARQPERAAQMELEAAAAGERGNASFEQIFQDLQRALELRPDSPWLLPLARRMLGRQQRYDQALELARREVERGGEALPRVAVLQEAAALTRHHQGDAKQALQLLEKALALQPGDIISLYNASELWLVLGRYEEAAAGLERLAQSLTSSEERALFLYQAGSLRETRLNQPDQAEEDYRRALAADRQHLPAALALSALCERLGKWTELCGALEHLAQLAPTPATEARLLFQAGSLHLDRTGDLEAATRDLSRAAEAAPKDPAPLQRLAYVHEARGFIKELIDTLWRLLELTLDAQGRAALLTHIGQLSETRLSDAEGAIAAYRRALQAVEGYLPALQSLSTLYRNRGDYENLLEIYLPEVEGTLPARARALRCLEMADILTDRLDRPEQAIQLYRRALELDPRLLPAFWGLQRLLQVTARHEELAELLEIQVQRSKDEKTKTSLLHELAQLRARALGEEARAVEILEGITDKDRSRAIALELLELYERTGRHPERVKALLAQGEDTSDPDEAQGRRLQAAAVLEYELEEDQRALEVYKDMLGREPQNVAALRGAGRIYYRLGWWSELVKLYYHELKSNPDRPDAPSLLCRIGRVLEENQGQSAAAIKAYAKALELDPACAPALPALERLVRKEKRWDDLVVVLQKHAAARADSIAAADALCRAAEIADSLLDNLELAAQLYEQARGSYPESIAAKNGLLRVYRRQQSWERAGELLRELVATSASEAERGQRQLELAWLREHLLQEAPDQLLYQAAADSAPQGDRLRVELARILRLSDSPGLAGWLLELGQRAVDPDLGAAQLMESALLEEFKGRDASASLTAARLAYRRRPENLQAIWMLERTLWQDADWQELAALREREAQLELTPAVRVSKLSAAALTYMFASEAAEAGRLAQECLNFDAHCLAALRVLAHLAQERDDHVELAALHDRIAETCADPENRLQSRLRAADLWAEQVGDVSRALASLSVALTDAPDDPEAFCRAERLLREGRRYGELSRLYKRRISACSGEPEKVEILRQHARLLRDDLQDPNQAIGQLNELLTLEPQDLEALADLAELLMAQRHWSDAAAKLGQLAELTGEGEIRRQARLDQARIWLQHLHEPQRARDALAQVLVEDEDDSEARRMLVELNASQGNWEETRRLLEQIVERGRPAEQSWATLRLAEVARLGLRDETLRRRYELEALRRAAQDPEVLEQLTRHYKEEGELLRLVEVGRQYLGGSGEATEALPIRLLLAQLLLVELGQPDAAAEALGPAIQREPGNQQLRLLSARILEEQGRGGEAGAIYQALIEEDVTCVAAYRGLGREQGRAGQHETETAAAALIDLLGQAEPEETALLAGLEGAMTPAGTIDLWSQLTPETLLPLERVLDEALPYLDELYPTALHDPLPDSHPAALACQRLAGPLELGAVRVALEDLEGARAGLGDPVPLLLSPELAENPGSPLFRFWVGRALCSAATGGVLLEQLDNEALSDLLEALCNTRPTSESVSQLRKQLSKVLPRKVRKSLDGQDPPNNARLWSLYREFEQQRAEQIGLVMSRSLREGLRDLARLEKILPQQAGSSPRLARLMRFSMSEDYARLARELWI